MIADKLARLSRESGSQMLFAPPTPKGTFTLTLDQALMANEFLFLDLESQITIFRIAARKASILLGRPVQGGLGIWIRDL